MDKKYIKKNTLMCIEKGYSLRRLAFLAGVSESTIWNWLRNDGWDSGRNCVVYAITDAFESFGECVKGEYILTSKELLKIMNSEYIQRRHPRVGKFDSRKLHSRLGQMRARKNNPVRVEYATINEERVKVLVLP